MYFNRDRMLYDEALSKTDVTSTVEDVVVVGGQLYIGVRGSDPENNHQGGNGKIGMPITSVFILQERMCLGLTGDVYKTGWIRLWYCTTP